MCYLLDFVYLLALLAVSPWLFWRALRTGRYRRGLKDKLLGVSPCHLVTLSPCHPAPVWFHGVSVGEVHLLRQVVAGFRRRFPGRPCVVSTTTDTGLEEARKCFPDLPVFAFPFDFSWAVRRTLRRLRPALIVLAEGELWPNLLLAARAHGVPVAVVNARMSPRSFRRYRRLGAPARWLFRRVDLFAAQTEEYAGHLRALGAPAGRVHVTGSVKFDGAPGDRHNPRTQELRRLFDVRDEDLVWVAGSTQAPEEEVVLDIYEHAKARHPNLRLFLVPRQRDRFDEVARLLRRRGMPFVRRSALADPRSSILGPRSSVALVDTIGELGALWGLADVAFVGGSLDGKRGGQNMIEAAAYGAAVVFGPHVWNFRDPAARLVGCGGALQVQDAEGLGEAINRLLADAELRRRVRAAGRECVAGQQGATEATVALLGELLARRDAGRAA
jgi:3-deoxy-D-manno-octulosonic-acid transferase